MYKMRESSGEDSISTEDLNKDKHFICTIVNAIQFYKGTSEFQIPNDNPLRLYCMKALPPYHHCKWWVKVWGTLINYCTELLSGELGWVVIAVLQRNPHWDHCRVAFSSIVYSLCGGIIGQYIPQTKALIDCQPWDFSPVKTDQNQRMTI